MNFPDHFDYFLRETVNLNPDRLRKLDERVKTVYEVLADSDAIGPWVTDWHKQGSWAHQTIIKPPQDAEFDADFLLQLKENPDWADRPTSYHDAVWSALDNHGTYKAMPHTRKDRCVRLVYQDDCHLDIVPFVIISGTDGQIINNKLRNGKGDWEDTNPTGFTEWFAGKDVISNDNFRRVIRILKWLRDDKGTFRGARSVILTTIAGNLVTWERRAQEPGCYDDVPRSLLTIMSDLDDWLQEHEEMPSVADPSRDTGTFDHRWNEDAYFTVRDRIHDYAAVVRDAYADTDPDTSLTRWQELFGPGFCAPPAPAAPRFGATPLIPRSKPSRGG